MALGTRLRWGRRTNMAVLSCAFWESIDRLKLHIEAENRMRHLRSLEEAQEDNATVVRLQELPRNEVVRKLEEIVEKIVEDISMGKYPVLRYNSRTSSKNTRFREGIGIEMLGDVAMTEVKFESRNSIGKFAATLRVISTCCKLLQENIYATKRDIYYTDVPFFGTQSTVDEIVDNLACMLQTPRHCLHVLAASKGSICGDLRYRELDGAFIDCAAKATGTVVSSHVEGIYDLYSDAKFVLIVEKEATFQRLLDDDIVNKLHPCIVITGKGFPDINTRMMIHKLWSTLTIPVLALVDADPYGVEILCIYKFGSKSLSFAVHSLAVPAIRWIGVLPSDVERLSISKNIQIPLTDRDKNRAQELLSRPYMQTLPAWRSEIQMMLATGYKAEIQALSDISVGFLADTYLPVKIRHGKWV